MDTTESLEDREAKRLINERIREFACVTAFYLCGYHIDTEFDEVISDGMVDTIIRIARSNCLAAGIAEEVNADDVLSLFFADSCT